MGYCGPGSSSSSSQEETRELLGLKDAATGTHSLLGSKNTPWALGGDKLHAAPSLISE